MDIKEYNKIKNLGYRECCEYFKSKYGIPSEDYFTINNLNKETDYYVYKGDSSVTDSATTYKFQLPISSLPNDENGDLTRMIETIVAQELNESVPRIVENVIDTAILIGSDSI